MTLEEIRKFGLEETEIKFVTKQVVYHFKLPCGLELKYRDGNLMLHGIVISNSMEDLEELVKMDTQQVFELYSQIKLGINTSYHFV